MARRGAPPAGDPRRATSSAACAPSTSILGIAAAAAGARRDRRAGDGAALHARSRRVARSAARFSTTTLEELVDERTADLSRANEEIQRFAYIVSHDLRSPLVNVMGFTAELDGATEALARAGRPRRGGGAAHRHRGRAAGGARGSARGDRLHPHLDAEDGPADQRDPQAVARGPPRRSRPSRSTSPRWSTAIGAIAAAHRSTSAARRSTVERPMPAHRQRPAGGRADPVQPDRECDQISRSPAAPGGSSCRGARDGRARVMLSVADNGRGIAPARPRARVRPVPPLGHAGPAGRGHRPRACPRARLSSGRHDRRAHRRLGEGVDLPAHPAATLRRRRTGPSMNDHRSVSIVMIEDDEGHARLIEKNIRRAGIMNDISHFTDGTTALDYLFNARRRPGAERPGAGAARPQPARHERHRHPGQDQGRGGPLQAHARSSC